MTLNVRVLNPQSDLQHDARQARLGFNVPGLPFEEVIELPQPLRAGIRRYLGAVCFCPEVHDDLHQLLASICRRFL